MVESPVNSAASSDDPHAVQRDRDFVQYRKEREDYITNALNAERSYDTLLASISTLALGASFTRDWPTTSFTFDVFLILAWVGFAACLILSLLHRYWTFEVHRAWVEKMSEMFKSWTPDIWDRLDSEFNKMPGFRKVERVKRWSGISVIVGIGMSFCLLVASRFASSHLAVSPASPFTQTINIYPTSQPSVLKVNP